MRYPLLTTKIYPPAVLSNLMTRERLTSRLMAGLERPLTLISAPAGFGKTTLLGEWRARCGGGYPLAWVSLDQGDNDPARFWAYVLASLRAVPGLSGLPEEIDTGRPPDLVPNPLINALEGASPQPIILVLDDYHEIESPSVHAAFAFLVEHMPSVLRLVVLTRSDPPLPLARLRAHGLMSELRASDLRFTAAEAARFFRDTPGTSLSASDIGALEQKTEGWIAALQMVAVSLDGHPDPQGFISAFSGENRYMTDYLTEEVLARQPEPLRKFLLQASILNEFTAPLCAAVTGYADTRVLIDEALDTLPVW